MKPFVKEFDMKKRFLAFLLAVCIVCSMLVVPANAAASNAAVQTAVTLGGLTSEQASALSTALTRGQLAKLLVAFSAYRESAATQGNTGTLFTDVDSGNEYAPYIRIAVQQGWLSGYTDGSFRPDNGVTLEEACTAALKLLGYDVTTLSGSFPAAQLNKASAGRSERRAGAGPDPGRCRHAGLYRDGWPNRPVLGAAQQCGGPFCGRWHHPATLCPGGGLPQ